MSAYDHRVATTPVGWTGRRRRYRRAAVLGLLPRLRTPASPLRPSAGAVSFA